MPIRWFLALSLACLGTAARAESPVGILRFIEQRLSSTEPQPPARIARQSDNADEPASRVSSISDVVIGDPQGTTYVGTAVWRDDNMLAWHNAVDDHVWVCQLDPETGDLIPPSGKGIDIGQVAPFVGNLFIRGLTGEGAFGTSNGPEWGNSQQGLGLYLTVPDENGLYQQAKSIRTESGFGPIEIFTFGGDKHKYSNLASQDADDEFARVGYYLADVKPQFSLTPFDPPEAFWQLDSGNDPPHKVPLDDFSFNGPRWIAGRHAFTTFLKDENGVLQVAIYNTDTETAEMITTGPERHAEAEIVVNPETGEMQYMTCIEDSLGVAVYELIDGEWQKLRTVFPEIPAIYAGRRASPFAVKPFLVRGELFFYYNVFIGERFLEIFNPLDIYLGSGDGSVNQRVTNGRLFSYRVNAQFYVPEGGNRVHLYCYSSLPLPLFVHLGKYHRVSFTID